MAIPETTGALRAIGCAAGRRRRWRPCWVAAAVVVWPCCAQAAETRSEFVDSEKVFADFIREGFDIKGTWGGHVIIVQKGNQVAFCDIILKNDLFFTLKHGCAVVNPKADK